jgi:hypothetical protein
MEDGSRDHAATVRPGRTLRSIIAKQPKLASYLLQGCMLSLATKQQSLPGPKDFSRFREPADMDGTKIVPTKKLSDSVYSIPYHLRKKL